MSTTPHVVPIGHCQRCRTPVEPRLSRQWFVKIAPLAEPAIRAVEDGRIKFVPESWAKTYFEWMRNIRDWVHQPPALVGPSHPGLDLRRTAAR